MATVLPFLRGSALTHLHQVTALNSPRSASSWLGHVPRISFQPIQKKRISRRSPRRPFAAWPPPKKNPFAIPRRLSQVGPHHSMTVQGKNFTRPQPPKFLLAYVFINTPRFSSRPRYSSSKPGISPAGYPSDPSTIPDTSLSMLPASYAFRPPELGRLSFYIGIRRRFHFPRRKKVKKVKKSPPHVCTSPRSSSASSRTFQRFQGSTWLSRFCRD